MGVTFAGQTHGLEPGGLGQRGLDPALAPRPRRHPASRGLVLYAAVLAYLELLSNSRDVSLVFVLPFVHVARLPAVVTFGLLEDK